MVEQNFMDKKMLFVFNPLSGRAQVKNNLMHIIDTFVKAEYEVTVHPTQCKLDAYNLIKKKAELYDFVVCCGGDGTLNETVKGLMECEKRPFLGYIPAGTTNDFAYSLNLPKNMKKASETIVSGIPFACDIGSFNGVYFTYVAAFGAFTDVSYQTPQQSKNMLGHLAYVLEGIKRIPTIKSYRLKIEHDGEIVEDDFFLALITNSISVGGYRNLGKMGIILDDGLFEATFIKQPKNPVETQNIITAVLKQDMTSPYIYHFKASEINISSEEALEWSLDGESGGAHNNVKILNHKQAINIIVNRDKKICKAK